ncbi:hypothetical protein OXX80_005352 [Metschnikowia pulcherrima]
MSEPLSRGKLFIEFEKDLEALKILVRCWKGRSRDAFYAIIDLAQLLEARYASVAFIKPTQIIHSLTMHFPTTASWKIEYWQTKLKVRSDFCVPEYLMKFGLEVLPYLETTREFDGMTVGKEYKARFDAMVEEIGFRDAFFEVSVSSHDSDTSTDTGTSKVLNSSKTRTKDVAEQYFFRIRKMLAKHPNVCPNCFAKHDLSKCTELKENPWENLASYTHPDFTQLTKKNQARRQKAFLRWVERNDTT